MTDLPKLDLICEGCNQLDSVCVYHCETERKRCCPECKHNLISFKQLQARDKRVVEELEKIICIKSCSTLFCQNAHGNQAKIIRQIILLLEGEKDG